MRSMVMSAVNDEKSRPPNPFVLPERMNFAYAPELHRALLDLRGQDLELDGSQVIQTSGSCLQVLLSASQQWAIDQVRFTLRAASPALQEALKLLGLTDHISSDGGVQCG
ncbi:MAG: STAS domain-containing protein [Alphaproteobacteria bacterium]|nr:MAG: STAS domain-containing protein [Alphaproteobacteria bacterium]